MRRILEAIRCLPLICVGLGERFDACFNVGNWPGGKLFFDHHADSIDRNAKLRQQERQPGQGRFSVIGPDPKGGSGADGVVIGVGKSRSLGRVVNPRRMSGALASFVAISAELMPIVLPAESANRFGISCQRQYWSSYFVFDRGGKVRSVESLGL